jgi:hypothetical protein
MQAATKPTSAVRLFTNLVRAIKCLVLRVWLRLSLCQYCGREKFGPKQARLFWQEQQVCTSHFCEITTSEAGSHNPGRGMRVRSKQRMADLVRCDVAENDAAGQISRSTVQSLYAFISDFDQ